MISSGANDELERLRAENAALFEAHQACYLVFGKDDGKIRRANGKVLTHFGDRLRLGETRIRDLFVHSDAERVDDAMAEIVGSPSRRSVVNEAYFRPRDSLPVPVDIVLADFGIDQILMEVSHCPVGNGAKAAEPLLTKSGDVTARVLHDVRNLLFPLVGQVELAMASIDKVTHEDYRRQYDVNVGGTIFAVQAVVPSMKRRGGGVIINVTSVGSLNTEDRAPIIYSAAKAGLERYLRYYSGLRPHSSLDRQTPDRLYFEALPLPMAA